MHEVCSGYAGLVHGTIETISLALLSPPLLNFTAIQALLYSYTLQFGAEYPSPLAEYGN